MQAYPKRVRQERQTKGAKMREPTEREDQKEEVLQKCFDCLVSVGLENVSIREFTKATGLNSSSLYYWFSDKDEIVLDATDFGLNKIMTHLFDYATKNINDIEKMCNGFPDVLKNYSSHLRLVFQVATSPQYGKRAVEISNHFAVFYDKFAKELSKKLTTDYTTIRHWVDLFVSAVVDCVIWNEWEKFIREINFLLRIIIP